MLYRAVWGLPEPPRGESQPVAVLRSIVEALDLSMECDDLATVWRRIEELKSRSVDSPELAQLEELVTRSASEPVTADDYCAALRAYLATLKPIRFGG